MNTPGGVVFDVSWISDNLLRKDICLSNLLRDRISSEPPGITINAVSEEASEVHVLRLLKLKTAESIHLNNVDRHLYSRVIQKWEKDVDSVKVKCIWELKDAPPLFKRHARKVARKASHMDFKKGHRGCQLLKHLEEESTVQVTQGRWIGG
ncbi:hypothetical protein L596_003672 [Steinernema carpocapsae]|uniref:Uncharacterized protein n=1 Tax=Steinernema carpocapsae TaxID=34508 RepID=A0A4U8UTC4_STECR|nr:hypothetical protein L596_003672 [Steinernema carpocapsae]